MNVKYIIPLLGKSAYLNIDVICSVDGYISRGANIYFNADLM